MPDSAVRALYDHLLARLGPQGWWPADTAEEMIIGAVLTQAVAWQNAARAIDRLREAGLLSLAALAEIEPTIIVPLIRPAGYFNVKARKLVAVACHITAGGGVAALAARPMPIARQELLGVFGVGPETADAILCYALGHPAMVADTYARRVLLRVGVLPASAATGYEVARRALGAQLPPDADAAWLGEWHALLVAVGKDWCRPREPRCEDCPAHARCAYAHTAAMGRGR